MFKSGDLWVGQCLEYDIAAQAKTLKELSYQLERALVGHLMIARDNGMEGFQNVPKAPARYWQMFEDGLKVETPQTHRFQVTGLPPVELPEFRVADPILT